MQAAVHIDIFPPPVLPLIHLLFHPPPPNSHRHITATSLPATQSNTHCGYAKKSITILTARSAGVAGAPLFPTTLLALPTSAATATAASRSSLSSASSLLSSHAVNQLVIDFVWRWLRFALLCWGLVCAWFGLGLGLGLGSCCLRLTNMPTLFTHNFPLQRASEREGERERQMECKYLFLFAARMTGKICLQLCST